MAGLDLSGTGTDGRPSATSAAALGSDAFGSGAAARQGGTTVALGLAGVSAAFGAGLETASLETGLCGCQSFAV